MVSGSSSQLSDDQRLRRDRLAFALTSQLCWAITGFLLLVSIIGIRASSIEFVYGGVPLNLAISVIFGVVAVTYTYVRFDARVAALCDAVALISAAILASAVYTYVATHFGSGFEFWDARFMAADRALGFDWVSYLRWMNEHPGLGHALDWAYLSVLKQLPVLIVLLVVLNDCRRLQTFVLTMLLWMVIGGAAPLLLPALGAYAFIGVDAAADHPNIPLATMATHVAQVMQLRGDTPVVELQSIEGIVVLPSFHMALAIFFAWGFWAVPIARWLALGLNVAMAAATPLSGGHYIVDLIAGAILAFLALASAHAIRTALERHADRKSLFGATAGARPPAGPSPAPAGPR